MATKENGQFFEACLGKRREYRELESLIRAKTPLVFLVGPPGAGKTAMARRALNGNPGVMIELRAYSSQKSYRHSYLVEQIESSLNKNKDARELRVLLGNAGLLEESSPGIVFKKSPRRLDLTSVFHLLDSWGERRNSPFVIIVDDARLLARFQHLNYEGIVAYSIDNLRNTSIVLIGESAPQMIKFCRIHNSKAPLFGRAYEIVSLGEITAAQKNRIWDQFLKDNNLKGRHLGRLFEKYERLPGLPSLMFPFLEELLASPDGGAVQAFERRMGKKAHLEFSSFLKNRSARDKYEKIISFLSDDPLNWAAIRKNLERDLGERLYDSNFNDLLGQLVKHGFVHNGNGQYAITDPFLASHYRTAPRGPEQVRDTSRGRQAR